MKQLFKFAADCGRSGDIGGIFVATQEEVDNIIGKEVGFGDALGKYSDVYFEIKPEHITKIDVSAEAVEELHSILGDTWSGYNPIEYYEGDDEHVYYDYDTGE